METFETLATDLVDCSSLKPSPSPIQVVDLLNGMVDLTPVQRLLWNISRCNMITVANLFTIFSYIFIQLLHYVMRGY